jgi:hypothetical protein
MSKSATATYPFVTRRQVQARIESEPAFMKECARTLQARTEQRVAGAAPPGKPWGWMSSERVVAGRLVAKVGVGMLSADDEGKLAKLVSRYSRQLADHHRAIALVENPALSEAAEKFGVLPTGFDPPHISPAQPEPKETAERCHPSGDYHPDGLQDDVEADTEPAPEDDLPRRAIEFVADNAGLRTDAIARGLGVTTALLAPTLRALVQGKQLRKQGVGRGTRYFVR